MEGVLLASEIAKVETLADGSVSIKIYTPELDALKAAQVFALRKKVAYVYISAHEIEADAKAIINSLDPELKAKTPQQRLRNVLYVYWEQNKERADVQDDFNDFYKSKIESFIDAIKQELT